jgi:maltose/moltooligosaccharide transporter
MNDSSLYSPAEQKTEVKPRIYNVGTLSYSLTGLIFVCVWMLGGCFCFTVMEYAIPRLLPVTFKQLELSNMMIGFFVGSVPSILGMIVAPVVGFRSDRHRGRLGRRIPFLLLPTPFIMLFMVIIGFSGDIGAWVHSALVAPVASSVSARSVTIVVTVASTVLFQFVNLIMTSIYYSLFADVVPKEFLGRFMALYRIVSQLGTLVFNLYIFGLVDGHLKELYVGIGLLYFVAFTLMCWRVKEGQYPPPPPQEASKGLVGAVKTYVHDCFGESLYRWFYPGVVLWSVSALGIGLFGLFFATKTIGLTFDQYGKIMAAGSLLATLLLYPFGWLCDKVSPLKVYIGGLLVAATVSMAGYFFIDSYWSLMVVMLIYHVGSAMINASNMPMWAAVYPKDRFGQFYSAQALVGCIVSIAASAGCGQMIDMFGGYRTIYAWSGLFTGIAVICVLVAYCKLKLRSSPSVLSGAKQ